MSDSLADYLDRYDRACTKAAHEIIHAYSTSFSMATRLLEKDVRTDICVLYAMVRIADEIVDGTAEGAGLDRRAVSGVLDDYERAVLAAPSRRFHVDPVLHAYGQTARRCGFDPEHVAAFFSSMRRDLHQASYGRADFEDYVYGSAEVIGLLCLSVFLADHPVTQEEYDELAVGARSLGAAFQKVNFLRDLAEDADVLGRSYIPGADGGELTAERKAALVADIRQDLVHARTGISLLPMSARVGVLAAASFFSELTDRIDKLTPAQLRQRRVSVPRHVKLALFARAVANAPGLRRPHPTPSKDDNR